jgi:hypothetical protein
MVRAYRLIGPDPATIMILSSTTKAGFDFNSPFPEDVNDSRIQEPSLQALKISATWKMPCVEKNRQMKSEVQSPNQEHATSYSSTEDERMRNVLNTTFWGSPKANSWALGKLIATLQQCAGTSTFLL